MFALFRSILGILISQGVVFFTSQSTGVPNYAFILRVDVFSPRHAEALIFSSVEGANNQRQSHNMAHSRLSFSQGPLQHVGSQTQCFYMKRTDIYICIQSLQPRLSFIGKWNADVIFREIINSLQLFNMYNIWKLVCFGAPMNVLISRVKAELLAWTARWTSLINFSEVFCWT